MASSSLPRAPRTTPGMLRVLGWTSAGAGALGALALFGCGGLGERARSGCPAGEVCSAETPDGLRFYGASIEGSLSNAPQPMALGGTQTVRFEDARASRPLPVHTTVTSAPDVLEVLSSSNGSAVLRAGTEGATHMRVVNPAGELLDRVAIRTMAIDHVAIAHPLVSNPTREIAFAVGQQHVGVALVGSGGTRLVDTGMTFGAASVDLSVAAGSWDAVELQLPAGGATFSVTSAGHTYDLTVPAAGTIDDIGVNPFLLDQEIVPSLEPLEVNSGGVICFDLLWHERAVVGADEAFTYRVDGVAQEGTDTVGCLGLPDLATATVTIEVTAAGLTRTFTAAVVRNDPSMALSGPLTLPQRGAFGERASLLRGLELPVLSPRGI
ncbi:MAG: hypothetical protein K1X94_06355 [Sandaracinaceae bacterium]|nr:hypothetical protein [Sandaracinaceae bacterium]